MPDLSGPAIGTRAPPPSPTRMGSKLDLDQEKRLEAMAEQAETCSEIEERVPAEPAPAEPADEPRRRRHGSGDGGGEALSGRVSKGRPGVPLTAETLKVQEQITELQAREKELLAEKSAIARESQSIRVELAAIETEKAWIEDRKQTKRGDPQIPIRQLNLDKWRSANSNRSIELATRASTNKGNFTILKKRQVMAINQKQQVLQNVQESNADIQQRLQNLQMPATAPIDSGPPTPAMVGPQQPPTVVEGRPKIFRTLAQGGAFGKKEGMAEMPMHMVPSISPNRTGESTLTYAQLQLQKFEIEHAAIFAEAQTIAVREDALHAEKGAIEQLSLSNPEDLQLPILKSDLKRRSADLVLLKQNLNERKSLLRVQIKKMRKDHVAATEARLYAQAETELRQMRIENKQIYGFNPAPVQMGDSHVRMQPQYKSAQVSITDFGNTQQNMQMQSDYPMQSSNAHFQQSWGAQNASHMDPDPQPQNTGDPGTLNISDFSNITDARIDLSAWKKQQIAGKLTLQQHKQEVALQQQRETEIAGHQQEQENTPGHHQELTAPETSEVLDPNSLPVRYGPGPYVGKGFDSPKLTCDLSSILKPAKLKQRDVRRQELDKIMNSPLGPLREKSRKKKFSPTNAFTPIRQPKYYPNSSALNPPLLQAQPKPVIDFTHEEPEDTMMEVSDVTETSAAQTEAQADAMMGTSAALGENDLTQWWANSGPLEES